MPAQFIFTMHDLRRVHPPDKEVLRGINISMFPGAKIGVLGANGSGKSSLLRIMAGEDDGYNKVCEAMGDPDADFDRLLAEQAELNDRIEAAGAWELDRMLEVAMDALNLPPGDAPVTNL